jgi:diguanylate cyclase (GGDEF)-like protein/PAS domain S-box-containing protein
MRGKPNSVLSGRASREGDALADKSEAHFESLLATAAIKLQQHPEAHADETLSGALRALADAAGADALFLLSFAPVVNVVAEVLSASATEPDPQQLLGVVVTDFPALHKSTARRSFAIRDTTRARELPVEAACLREWGWGAALVAAIVVSGRVRGLAVLASRAPRRSFGARWSCSVELLAASYASSLERRQYAHHAAALEERSALALHGANDGVWDFDLVNGTAYFSPRWKLMLGYSDEELSVLSDWRPLVHPQDLPKVQSLLSEHLAGKATKFESMHRVRHRDGDWIWVMSRGKASVDGSGQAQRLVGVDLDITERRLFEEALFHEKESAQITLRSIGDGVISADACCRVEYLNPVAEELTGWRLEHARGRRIEEVFRSCCEEEALPLENPLVLAVHRGDAIKSANTAQLIRRDGSRLHIESCASPIRDNTGAITGGVLVFHDVTERRELNAKLSYHASHDQLTGLVNRREFEIRLEKALRRVRKGRGYYALAHLDLDLFKIINDNRGHGAGDALLAQVGALLAASLSGRNALARLGGDAFGVLFECAVLEDAELQAEALRETIQNHRFPWDGHVVRLSASIGVVPITAQSENAAALLGAADGACAAAKDAGRNRVHSFRGNDLDLLRRRQDAQWAARINQALEDDRFEIYRQIIQPLQASSEHGAHYELLLRMRDDEAGTIISPDQFICVAERYRLTPSIDRWMIEHAFDWLASSSSELSDLSICAINLSGQSLGDDKFLRFVIEHFARSGVEPGKICFEITETAAVASFTQARRAVQALKDLGCRFALDDFGTGFSSFGYLKHFPVDYLKIDGSFVREIVRDPIDHEMVRSINEIGHLTGKQTIAEFAENDAIIEMLRTLGIDYAQGYGISPPQCVAVR